MQIDGKYIMKKRVNSKKIFCWLLHTTTKGWYLCCYKYRCGNLYVYPNINSRESRFLFRGNSSIQFNHKKTPTDKAQTKTSILKTNEKSGITAVGTKSKKYLRTFPLTQTL